VAVAAASYHPWEWLTVASPNTRLAGHGRQGRTSGAETQGTIRNDGSDSPRAASKDRHGRHMRARGGQREPGNTGRYCFGFGWNMAQTARREIERGPPG
jgi:hypothetical protein